MFGTRRGLSVSGQSGSRSKRGLKRDEIAPKARRSRAVMEALETRRLMTGAADNHTVLIYGPSVANLAQGGLTGSYEEKAAIAAGMNIEVASAAQWATKSQADFATYRALIFGDPNCSTSIATLAGAQANQSTWAPAVTGSNAGNDIIIGTDPVYHGNNGIAGAVKLINEGIAWAVAAPGKTGVYMDLSCYYSGALANTPVPILDAFKPGGFTVVSPGCTDAGHVVASTPAGQPLSDLTDGNFSAWSCSVHEAFTTFDPSFTVLVIDESAGSSYTASDGTKGDPYILVKGANLSVVSDIHLAPLVSNAATGTNATLTATVTVNTPSAGTPVVGATVNFTILSGPNAGKTGTGMTDGSGHATFTYSSSVIGTDTIDATYVDTGGQTNTSEIASVTWAAVAAPAVLSVQVGDGNIQRSMVKSLQVTFSEPVTLDASSFSVVATSGGATPTVAFTTALNGSGNTVATLTFSGSGVVGTSLSDGRYKLTVSAAHVTNSASENMASDYTFTFFRLFGDINGNGKVDNLDLHSFIGAYTTYNSYFDYNNDGVVNGTDLAQLMARRNYILP